MEEPKGVDKRSRQYRQYKEWQKNFEAEQSKKPEGLGDVVKSITKATRIDKLVKFIAGEDCGCDERQEILNKKFPFAKIKCLNEDEFNYLSELLKKRIVSINFQQRNRMYEIYNRIFGTKLKNTTCSSCLSNIKKKLEVILKTYK